MKIRSTFSQAEVIELIQSHTQPLVILGEPKLVTKFHGSINDNQFKLLRVTNTGQPFQPWIIGTVEQTENGSTLSITFKPVIISIAFWGFFGVLFLAFGILTALAKTVLFIIPTFVIITGIVIIKVSYKHNKKISEEVMREVIHAAQHALKPHG